MSLTKQQRTELLNRIKQGCKSAKLSEDTLPTTWADRVALKVPVIPTPSARLNACLGIGGIPIGRIVEVYGTESSGKTTLMLQLIATAQKMGMATGYIDMEHALDPKYAEALGVEMNDLFISQPPDGSDALELAKVMVQSGIKLIVIDSIPALVNRDEYEKEITDSHVGLQARMLSQACRQLTPKLGLAGATAVFINQIREKIGVLYGNQLAA
jgi:recombination protein RecA